MIRNKKYNYFYKITNTKSGEYYFGVHSTDDLNDGYLGSGTRIKEAIEKEGKENFNKEIIKFFSTITEALEEEARVVTKDLVDDPMCYNMVLGGGGYNNSSLTVIDKELGIKVVITSEEYQENKDRYESLIKGKNNGMYGKMWITNGKDSTIIDKSSNIPEGWRKGKVSSRLNKDEIMEEYLSGICIRKLAKIHNTSVNIINKVLDLPDDSKLIWFYNDSKRQNIHIKINEENINKVLKNGWKLGRKKY